MLSLFSIFSLSSFNHQCYLLTFSLFTLIPFFPLSFIYTSSHVLYFLSFCLLSFIFLYIYLLTFFVVVSPLSFVFFPLFFVCFVTSDRPEQTSLPCNNLFFPSLFLPSLIFFYLLRTCITVPRTSESVKSSSLPTIFTLFISLFYSLFSLSFPLPN